MYLLGPKNKKYSLATQVSIGRERRDSQKLYERVRGVIAFIFICTMFYIVLISSKANAGSLHDTKYDEAIKQSVQIYWTDFPIWQLYKAQLYQESLLDTNVTSYVGAKGLAQFMPRTWLEMQRRMDMPRWVTPYVPEYSIKAGAYYMRRLRDAWTWKRDIEAKHDLALASYNAGIGNVLKAQKECLGEILWENIAPCLKDVTGRHSKETIDYVRKVHKWFGLLY